LIQNKFNSLNEVPLFDDRVIIHMFAFRFALECALLLTNRRPTRQQVKQEHFRTVISFFKHINLLVGSSRYSLTILANLCPRLSFTA